MQSVDGGDAGTKEAEIEAAEFYNSRIDVENEEWLRKTIASYYPEGCQPNESNTMLNCPACLSVICLDSQRHDVYPDQFRAIFVVNCSLKEKCYTYKDGISGSGGRLVEYSEENRSERLQSVVCSVCDHEVAILDENEVYHFFRAIPSTQPL